MVILRCLDLETRLMEGGLPDNEVYEAAFTDVVLDTTTKGVTVGPTSAFLFRNVKPMIPANQAIHHLTAADLEPHEPCTPEDLRLIADGADFLVAHNWAFEGMFFTHDILAGRRAICTYKASLRLWPDFDSHSCQAVKYELGLEGLPHSLCMPPHRAGPDTFVTAHILARMLETERVSHLVEWTLMPRHIPRCPFEKHKNQPWSAVPYDFLNWMIFKATDMDEDLKAAARGEIQRRREVQST